VEGPASEQMHVQMKYGLAGSGAGVNHGSIAFGIEATLVRQAAGHKREVAQKRYILRLGLQKGVKMLAWNHQHVSGRLRMNVLERQHVLILKNNLRGNFPVDNSAEKAVIH
jgi:hypothetical protein